MSLSRRYSPEFAPGESCNLGYDFSPVIPPGVGIVSGSLSIYSNTPVPQAADADFTVGAVNVLGRAIYARLSGGTAGKDYQLRWTATYSHGDTWPRVGLMLCAPTS